MTVSKNHAFDSDRDVVDVSAEHECQFWLKKFGVTYAQLAAAARTVGPRVTALKRYFGETV
jgi:hypothetical protein